MKSSIKTLLRALVILVIAAGLGWGIYAIVESAGSAQPDSISSAQGFGAGAHGPWAGGAAAGRPDAANPAAGNPASGNPAAGTPALGGHGRPPATPGTRLLGFALSLAKFAAFFLVVLLIRGLSGKKAPAAQPSRS
jgi:hypothetical protein